MADAGNTVILVADSDLRIRQEVASTLEKAGFTVEIVSDAAGAMAMVTRHGDAIQLAIVDTALAAGSPELIGDIRRDYPAVRFLFTSTADHHGSLPPTGRVRQVLEKPFRRSQLLGQVLKALDAPLIQTA